MEPDAVLNTPDTNTPPPADPGTPPPGDSGSTPPAGGTGDVPPPAGSTPPATGDKVTPPAGDKNTPPAGDTPPPAAGTFPENWKELMTEGLDDKAKQMVNRYGSPKALAEALVSLRAKLSSGAIREPLKDGATDAEKAEWRKANGIPETPEKMLEGMQLDDGLIIGEEDKPMVGKIAEALHGVNATPAQLRAGINAYYQIQAEELAALEDSDHQLKANVEDSLRKEWGQDYRRNINLVNNQLEATFGPDLTKLLLNSRLSDSTPLASNTGFIRGVLAMAKEINPLGTVVPGVGTNQVENADARLGELRKMMGDKKSDYWKGPNSKAIQAEYRELTDAKAKLAARGR